MEEAGRLDWRESEPWCFVAGPYKVAENRGQWFVFGADPADHGPYNDMDVAFEAAQSHHRRTPPHPIKDTTK